MHYPQHLLKLIDLLKKLPGVGRKSAERYAFQLINWQSEHLEDMAITLKEVKSKLKHCEECGCLKGEKDCPFCTEERIKRERICIIASARDAYSIEETREYLGLYHVLGGLLSPMEGKGPEHLRFDQLLKRIHQYQIKEVIIALDSTLEGDATTLFLKKELESKPINITRLALGLPMGSAIDYVDGNTLTRAFIARSTF